MRLGVHPLFDPMPTAVATQGGAHCAVYPWMTLGALALYLDFINPFLLIFRVVGRSRD